MIPSLNHLRTLAASPEEMELNLAFTHRCSFFHNLAFRSVMNLNRLGDLFHAAAARSIGFNISIQDLALHLSRRICFAAPDRGIKTALSQIVGQLLRDDFKIVG